jgi:hypothetical protein
MGLFDWLRGKKKFDDAAMGNLVDSIEIVLKIQLTIVASHESDLATARGAKALGYVYGFVDAALRNVGQDMAYMLIGVPVMYQVLRRVFPGCEERYFDFILQSIQSDPNLMIGIMKGGQQYMDWLNRKLKAPMGLARYLIELQPDQQESKNDA